MLDNKNLPPTSLEMFVIYLEVNGNELTNDDKIIANPNCSTIQMLIALAPIHIKYGITRIIVSTYHEKW